MAHSLQLSCSLQDPGWIGPSLSSQVGRREKAILAQAVLEDLQEADMADSQARTCTVPILDWSQCAIQQDIVVLRRQLASWLVHWVAGISLACWALLDRLVALKFQRLQGFSCIGLSSLQRRLCTFSHIHWQLAFPPRANTQTTEPVPLTSCAEDLGVPAHRNGPVRYHDLDLRASG